MLVTIGLFWFLAAVVYVLGEWVAPTYYSGTAASTISGFNWGQALSLPFAKAFGLWQSGIVFAFGPVAAAPIAIERGFGFVVRKAQGLGDNQRDTRRQPVRCDATRDSAATNAATGRREGSCDAMPDSAAINATISRREGRCDATPDSAAINAAIGRREGCRDATPNSAAIKAAISRREGRCE